MDKNRSESRKLILRIGLELVIYAALVVAYMYLVLSLLGADLVILFKRDPVMYAALALGLMAFQGVFLESVTTFLINRLEI